MTELAPLTEELFTRILCRDRWKRHFCVPRFTPAYWWECDLFQLSDADIFTEYEVKLTVADFRRDPDKIKELPMNSEQWEEWNRACDEARRAGLPRPIRATETKHALIAAGDPRAPSRFYYVTPVGLLDGLELPPWAGLIELEDSRKSEYGVHPFRMYERLKVKGPKIHGHKFKRTPNYHMGTCYYRMHQNGKAYET